jgi:hypothetical protein
MVGRSLQSCPFNFKQFIEFVTARWTTALHRVVSFSRPLLLPCVRVTSPGGHRGADLPSGHSRHVSGLGGAAYTYSGELLGRSTLLEQQESAENSRFGIKTSWKVACIPRSTTWPIALHSPCLGDVHHWNLATGEVKIPRVGWCPAIST